MKTYSLLDSNNNPFECLEKGLFGGNKKLKIYGKLNCKSALSYIEKGHYITNRVFFKDETTAIDAGYRPCGKCMKEEYDVWKNNKLKAIK
ncbi:Ada metal-binding domain-containing protein [Paenisporosarcina sp. TG20]|uniref:Ada metal-binding domain-containing protein n=1 Tax=Paenisporosarcina sp. TG20 TaxID=1211706 RepID=UPI00035E86FD|nr:Ada metal-binding domain-containing protein [Paenisporosarcina sp. TG20]